MNDLDKARSELLRTFQQKVAKIRFPIRRRVWQPDDFRNMINPILCRRDYTSLGRPVFLVGYTDTELSDD